MKTAKSRFFGLILLILSVAILLTGVFGRVADQESLKKIKAFLTKEGLTVKEVYPQ